MWQHVRLPKAGLSLRYSLIIVMMVMIIVIVVVIIIILMIIIIIIIIIAFRGAFRDFYNLLTASRTVSNTYARVARAQSCANHVQIN